jgi:hypothetical protein
MYIYIFILGSILLIFYFERDGGLCTRGPVLTPNSMWEGKDLVGQWSWIFPALNLAFALDDLDTFYPSLHGFAQENSPLINKGFKEVSY